MFQPYKLKKKQWKQTYIIVIFRLLFVILIFSLHFQFDIFIQPAKKQILHLDSLSKQLIN